ncbi:glycosyltransferase family 61 protein [Ponticaulis profundi]|uniref:Glycosyltransferase family 61 protein n=1 Tax=Ponticaulis profundi TaxID=2665222 RepID=A0ABW1S4P9_9PROT
MVGEDRKKIYNSPTKIRNTKVEVLKSAQPCPVSIRPTVLSSNPFYARYLNKDQTFKFPAITHVTVKNPILLMPEHIIVIDDTPYFDLSLLKHKDITRFLDLPPVELNMKARLISNNNSGNYAHWSMEILPAAVEFLRRSQRNKSALKNRPYILPPINPNWQHKAGHALGLVSWHHPQIARGVIRTEELEFLSISDHSRDHDTLYPEALTWVAEKIGSVAVRQNHDRQFPEKIFLARRDSNRRVCRNTDALSSALEELGFTEINTTDLDIYEQVMLFRSAEQVVALHGAGLANIMYCRPGTKVVEIQSPSLRTTTFSRLAIQFQLDLAIVQEFNGDEANKNLHQTDWSIGNLPGMISDIKDFLG